MRIDVVEICFGVANGQIKSLFDRYLPTTRQWHGITISHFYFYFLFLRQNMFLLVLIRL